MDMPHHFKPCKLRDFPIWVLVELVSFGELIQLCTFYDETRSPSRPILIEEKFLNIIRDFRNASAHSNCLLNKAAARMAPRGLCCYLEYKNRPGVTSTRAACTPKSTL